MERPLAKIPFATAKRSRKVPASIGRAFARDIEQKMIGATTMSYAQVVRSLRTFERHYLELLKGHPERSLEIQRRIAENKLEQSLYHGCAISTCRANLNALSHLGFVNVERKAHFYLLYAKGALARGHKRTAKQVALVIEAELARSLKKRNSPLAKQCLLHTQKLLDSIKQFEGT